MLHWENFHGFHILIWGLIWGSNVGEDVCAFVIMKCEGRRGVFWTLITSLILWILQHVATIMVELFFPRTVFVDCVHTILPNQTELWI